MKMNEQFSDEALKQFAEVGSDAPEQAARFLKSLAHKDRLKILCCLVGGEKPVAEIEAAVGASQSAVSQHLTRFRDEGILESRREGRKIYYAIKDATILSIITLLYHRFCEGEGTQSKLS